MKFLGILLLLLLQLAKPTLAPEVPAAPGLYYRQSDMKWINLEPAPKAEIKTKGMGSYIATDGLSNLGTSVVFRGAHAPTRISVPKPTLFVRGIGSSKDVMLVQFARRKDSRALHTSTSDATVANKEGFKKGSIRKVAVNFYSDDLFSVTPEEDLKSGEYLLMFGHVTTGYDFGLDLAKK